MRLTITFNLNENDPRATKLFALVVSLANKLGATIAPNRMAQ